MKYNIEIEVDDKAIKDSGMEPDSYIRQEMGWLGDSGISLISLGTAEEQSVPSQVNLNQENYYSEYQGGVEWHIAQDPNLPVAAYVSDKDSGESLIEIREVKDTSLVWGEYELRIGKEEPLSFDNFDEAVEAANDYLRKQEVARNKNPEAITYKGIPLEGLDKHVSMAHSHFIGTNEGIDHLTALLSRDKQSLTPEQFEAMSALNSVAVMNYQICNGGLDQYYFNQCHKEREPFSESDVKLVNKEQQVEMLRELHAFGCEVFPERAEDNEQLDRIINDFEESSYTEPGESWLTDDEEEDEGNLHAPYDFDDRYYEVNDYLETLIESYAQYLDKSIEKELAVDGRETFYFSFGTSEHFPFELGWVEVRAKDRMEACEMYSSHYPKRDGLINCSFVYNESEWKKSGLSREELGHDCHQVITDWGPFAEKNLFDVPTKDGRTEKLRVEAGYWSESKNLTVTIYPNIKEPEYGWDYPMVEISEDLGRQPLMHAVVAERADYDIPKFLQESGLAEPTGLYQLGKNDFGEEHLYPTYEFKLDKLMEIDPEMTSRYLKEHGFTVDQAREYLIASKEEKPLDELVKEAKAKAAEKNAERTNPPQQDLKGIDR